MINGIPYIDVIPGKGIGPLRLDMTPEEILAAINELRAGWRSPHGLQVSFEQDAQDASCTYRYLDGASFFMVRFRDGRAEEIAVDYEIRSQRLVRLMDMDVFRIPAEEVVAALKPLGGVICDSEDELLGTDYGFPDIGVRLWREEAFHPKLMEDEAYVRLMGDTLPEMAQYRFFQLAAVNCICKD